MVHTRHSFTQSIEEPESTLEEKPDTAGTLQLGRSPRKRKRVMDGLYEKGAYDYYPHASTRSRRSRENNTPEQHARHTPPEHSTAVAVRSRRSNSPTRCLVVSPIGKRLRRYNPENDPATEPRVSSKTQQDSNKNYSFDELAERRKSTRQRTEMFGTLNEQCIQESHLKKIKEELEQKRASMYDGIKRRRINQDEDEEDDESEEDDEEEEEEDSEEEDDEEEDEEEESRPAYNMRTTRKAVKRYAPTMSTSTRRRHENIYALPHSPMHKVRHRRIPQHGSSRKKTRDRTSSTSSSGSDDDEERFERRKSKSMAQARHRCLPMNFRPDDLVGVLKDRNRAREQTGSSLADIDPMCLDSKTKFEDVGGLDRHIRSLKEMVIFPLLYPEVFEKFHIAPPRGVLFYGPPGTGKTLVARALANECSQEGQKVAFFMRKGADCLSKWVGESERQLRLLFDQAYSMRPSIIFFDEIDGLAPVRSTRQDQIHSSIVSTLLALMDGLDARKEIVVIGATNRLDSIDPALRRPGRFDREFLFNLPNRKARERILQIHTNQWNPKLDPDFIQQAADRCVGYCGADIKALCTEAALFALRRRYPQVYQTSKKLVLNVDDIKVSSKDFQKAMKNIIPASQRANASPGRALENELKPLLQSTYESCLEVMFKVFPPGKPFEPVEKSHGRRRGNSQSENALKIFDDDETSEEEESGLSIFNTGSARRNSLFSSGSGNRITRDFFTDDHKSCHKATTYRPRLLIHGCSGNGQTAHIGPALLYAMEHLTVYILDLPSLFGITARAPEEAIGQIFREARRTAPSVIYIPHIGVLWESISDMTRATLMSLLNDLPPTLPVLFMATANNKLDSIDESIKDIFFLQNNEAFEVPLPLSHNRYDYFKDLFLVHALAPPPQNNQRRRKKVEVLPEAPLAKERQLSNEECKKLIENEESTLRELRLFLRQITWKLLADRKFKEFSRPVNLEEVDDYLEVIKEPMDLSTMMTRINSHHYHSCAHYLLDVDLITNNCLEYNPDRDQFDKLLRNRACELRDTAYALVYKDLDPDFEKLCIEIHETREKRGTDGTPFAPSFMKVLPKHMVAAKPGKQPVADTKPKNTKDASHTSPGKPSSSIPVPDPRGERFSRRVRGIHDANIDFAVDTVPIEYRARIKKLKEKKDGEESALDNALQEKTVDNAENSKIEQDADIADSVPNLVSDIISAVDETSNEGPSKSDSDKENNSLIKSPVIASKNENPILNDNESDKMTIELPQLEDMEEKASIFSKNDTETATVTDLTNPDTDVKSSYDGSKMEQLSAVLDTVVADIVDEEKVSNEMEIAQDEINENTSSTIDEEKAPVKRTLHFQEQKEEVPCLDQEDEAHSIDEIPLRKQDRSKYMSKLLDELVRRTENATVSNLEKIFNRISRCIYDHRKEENKTDLMKDLLAVVNSLSYTEKLS